MEHDCIQEETIGKIKEFISSTKGTRTALFGVVIAIVVQVGTFLFLWGTLTTTVSKNTDYLWSEISPKTFENTRNIDKILTKLDILTFTKNANAESIK